MYEMYKLNENPYKSWLTYTFSNSFIISDNHEMSVKYPLEIMLVELSFIGSRDTWETQSFRAER